MMIVAVEPKTVKPVDVTDTINARLAERDAWLTEFSAGQFAFRRGEFPRQDWSAGKLDGWNFAGELANLAATAAPAIVQERWADREECEYLPLSDEPGYSESLQPWQW